MDGSTVIRRSPDAASQPVSSGAALMHLQTGAYHQINPTGQLIWDLLAKPVTVSRLAALVAERLGEGPAAVESDVLTFVEDLRVRGLVEVAKG